MLQIEFEERIGRKVTKQEYMDAHDMYMLAGDDVDKDTFCREWKKIGCSPLVRGLYGTASKFSKHLNDFEKYLDYINEVSVTTRLRHCCSLSNQ